MESADIIGKNYSGYTAHERVAARGIVCRGESILLSHETVSDLWMIPGGGLEGEETPEECCVREILEETGVVTVPERCFLILNEYYEDWKYISMYFPAKPSGTADRNPTEREKEAGAVPEWIPISEALRIFSRHADYTDTDEERRGIYLREYTALRRFLDLREESR